MRKSHVLVGVLVVTVARATAGAQCLEVKLEQDLPAGAYNGFGLAAEGNTAVVGAYGDDPWGPRSGSAQVYELSAGEWSMRDRLVPDDGMIVDAFGQSIDLDGDRLLIGAPSGLQTVVGAAYVFEHDGTAWRQAAKLQPAIGQGTARFGWHVAIDGDRALVCAVSEDVLGFHDAGAVYFFEERSAGWCEVAKFTSPEPGDYRYYGWSGVELSGDRAVVASVDTGSVYVYEHGAGGWGLSARLAPEGLALGRSIDLQGDRLLVGGRAFSVGSGAAFLFEWNGATWRQTAVLRPEGARKGWGVGTSVALRGPLAVVGGFRPGSLVGGAFVFRERDGVWDERPRLRPSDGANWDYFGTSVAVSSSGYALVSSPEADNPFPDSGAVYAYDRIDADVGPYCTAKTNSAGCVAVIAADGCPSATSSSGFVVSATRVVNRAPGLLLYSLTGRAATPFRGGTLCVSPPVLRGPGQDSGGHLPPIHDCSGSYRVDMNAFASGGLGGVPDPALRQLATPVFCQWFSRDGKDPHGAGLSDALEYLVGT